MTPKPRHYYRNPDTGRLHYTCGTFTAWIGDDLEGWHAVFVRQESVLNIPAYQLTHITLQKLPPIPQQTGCPEVVLFRPDADTNTTLEATHEWYLSEQVARERITCAVCGAENPPNVEFQTYDGQPICNTCAYRATSYNYHRSARIDRLEERAERKAAQAHQTFERARDMASIIPFGQPILVGHHSEKWDRRYRDRIDRTFRRGYHEHKDAERLAQKAEAAAKNTAISSDDPLAVLKLEAKIAEAEQQQEDMKRYNKATRAVLKKDLSHDERVAWLMDELGVKERTARNLLEPDYAGRYGIPSYALTNNNANIRRMKQRLDDLRAQVQRVVEADGDSEREVLPGVTVIEAHEDNRLRLVFDGKPSADVREVLKSNGWRWSRANMAWQRHLNVNSQSCQDQIEIPQNDQVENPQIKRSVR